LNVLAYNLKRVMKIMGTQRADEGNDGLKSSYLCRIWGYVTCLKAHGLFEAGYGLEDSKMPENMSNIQGCFYTRWAESGRLEGSNPACRLFLVASLPSPLW
jgi:hypothetical protein